MTPQLTKIFNAQFKRGLAYRIESHYEFFYPKFAPTLKEKFDEFMTGVGDDEITKDSIESFSLKVEDEGLRSHVRIGLDRTYEDTRTIVQRFYGPI